jgi:hypothetical protein
MRTRLPGLLISASIILSTAAQAETTPVVPSFFRTIEVRVDTILIAANLAVVGPAVAHRIHQSGDNAYDQTLEPAAMSVASAETASAAPGVEHQHGLSAPDQEHVTDANESGNSTSIAIDRSSEAVEETGSISASATPEEQVRSDHEEGNMAEARSEPSSSTNMVETQSVSGLTPPRLDGATKECEILLP